MRRLLLLVTVISVGFLGAAGASGVKRVTIPSVLTCAGKVVIRPASYVLACADGNSYFDSIKWTTWGTTSATGAATFVENNCEPDCAAGKFIDYPATLRLSKPKSTKLGLLFGSVNYTYDVSESTTLPLTKL